MEQNGGQFLHHDGGIGDGHARLASLLPKADAVLCPLDCISHDAMYRIKKFCKHNGKPLALLPRASLSAFTAGLHQVVN